MSEVLVFQHIRHEGPGYLGDFFDQHGIHYRVIRVDEGESVPAAVDDAPALVFMGGPMSVNDPLPWIDDELKLIRQAVARKLPVLGHCLGGQLIAKALGARVHANPVTEIGWHETVRLNNEAARDWLAAIPESAELFHWHGETFELPDGATPLMKSGYCRNQAFVYGNSLAFQCHIEMTAALVHKWVEESRGELTVSDSVQSEQQMLHNLPTRISQLNGIAEQIYTRWMASW